MAVKPISIREMEKQSDDIFETVVVMSKRAKQITQNRFMEQAMKEAEEFDMGALDELPPEPKEDYEEETKPTTQAMDEFMDGDLKWQTLPEPEEDN
jgi:DNA-directed RNA polymerase subunit K/omega